MADAINTFKFRAELMSDVDRLVRILEGNGKKVRVTIDEEPPWIGVVVEMDTAETLDAIKDAMRKVEDGHVMLQTVAPKGEYTGERRYNEK